MSGGSLEYLFRKVDDLADLVELYARTPLQKAFVVHLRKVSKAAQALESEWSGDDSEGSSNKALKAVVTPATLTASAIQQLQKAMTEGNSVLKSLRGKKYV